MADYEVFLVRVPMKRPPECVPPDCVFRQDNYTAHTTQHSTRHAPRAPHHAPHTTHHAPHTMHHTPCTTHHTPRRRDANSRWGWLWFGVTSFATPCVLGAAWGATRARRGKRIRVGHSPHKESGVSAHVHRLKRDFGREERKKKKEEDRKKKSLGHH